MLSSGDHGWTWEPVPRSRRIDWRMVNVVLVVNAGTSAAPRTPVYLAMIGVAACLVTSSRYPPTPAQAFCPYFWKYGVGSTEASAAYELSTMSAMYCWCRRSEE